jgi:hypothetical protein
MSDFDEPWPKEVLIPARSGFFRRAFAVAVSSFSSLSRATMILPDSGGGGCLGPLDAVPGAIRVDPTFKMIYLSAVGLTVLVFAAWVLLASFAQPTDAARSLISGCETISKLGFGALFGLVGGKTTPTTPGSRRR